MQRGGGLSEAKVNYRRLLLGRKTESGIFERLLDGFREPLYLPRPLP